MTTRNRLMALCSTATWSVFVTTSGKDDLGRRLCFLDGVMVMAAGSVSWEIAQHLEMTE